MIKELENWNIGMLEENEPQYFLEVLSEIQDFFCNRFTFFSDDEIQEYKKNTEYIKGIMYIKDALRPLAEVTTTEDCRPLLNL